MNAESVKARLKNFAVSSGCTLQDTLVYYRLERTIYRLSVSSYASHFVLKGGIFLYAIFDRKYERATTDVDLNVICKQMGRSPDWMLGFLLRVLFGEAPQSLLTSPIYR